MTGFGEARRQDALTSIRVEVRSVNHRHFKLNAKWNVPCPSLEPELERLVRNYVQRGVVQVGVQVDEAARADDFRINALALRAYLDQVTAAAKLPEAAIPWASLLLLPGVVENHARGEFSDGDRLLSHWPRVRDVAIEALENLQKNRLTEGQAMERELISLAKEMSGHAEHVSERVPKVVADYQTRLRDRVQALIAESGVLIEPRDLVKEVAVFADRADVAEELTRLRAHLERFDELVRNADSPGRALEFLIQEMGREINTLGSKANDLEISRAVLDLKSALEKVRELVQNIE
jgi:uncharacterized protein (TIGR00255 family)